MQIFSYILIEPRLVDNVFIKKDISFQMLFHFRIRTTTTAGPDPMKEILSKKH